MCVSLGTMMRCVHADAHPLPGRVLPHCAVLHQTHDSARNVSCLDCAGPAVHGAAGLCAEAPAGRPAVQAGVAVLRGGAPSAAGWRQGEGFVGLHLCHQGAQTT